MNKSVEESIESPIEIPCTAAGHFELVQGVCRTDGAQGRTVYGVRARLGSGIWEWADVAADRRQVEELLRRLEIARPEPCHLQDIVEDYIGELALLP